ncbi:hypothetical protein [Halomonas sp.]|uniref:hypothetical protein n=1 Tax=Halomonas sp. TaxID=1486246 RepID=UPI002604940F|nr:hypothetical protein [Halomonas sp.]
MLTRSAYPHARRSPWPTPPRQLLRRLTRLLEVPEESEGETLEAHALPEASWLGEVLRLGALLPA